MSDEEVQIPDWLVRRVGGLVIQNDYLQEQLRVLLEDKEKVDDGDER